MKKFRITTTIPAVQYNIFYVEAETEQDAIAKIFEGEVDPVGSELEIDMDSEEIQEVEELED